MKAKPLLLSVVAIFLTKNVNGQIGSHNILKQSTIEKYCFELQKAGKSARICKDYNAVISVSNGIISVDFWDLDDREKCETVTIQGKGTVEGIDYNTPPSEKITLTDKRASYSDPVSVLKLPFRSWTVGLNTLPFRYRAPVTVEGNRVSGTATTAFNLAVNFGRTWGYSYITSRAINTRTLTVGVFGGPSSTDLKKSTVRNPNTWITDRTNATIIYGLNAVLARNTLGVVFAVGFEQALGELSSEWIYNNQPFVAFGVNTSFGR